MKKCDLCPNEATSRTARFCLTCRKKRAVENGRTQGKRNAAAGKGRIWVEPTRRFDTLVFVPSRDEDEGLITCGNAVLAGRTPKLRRDHDSA